MAYLSVTQKSLLYTAKIALGALLCWGLLTAIGIENPIWAVITVVLVSDPDWATARGLVMARVINTFVGCTVGFVTLTLFGYTMEVALITITLMILAITSIASYPANWRLAPVTVLILLDAGRHAANGQEAIHFALLRGIEIMIGSAVALLLSRLATRFFTGPKTLQPTSAE